MANDTTPPSVTLPPCLYCGSGDSGPWLGGISDRLGHVEGTWGFRRCRGCDSGILTPHPEASRLESFYPEVYSFNPEPGNQGRAKRLLAWLEHALFFAPQFTAQTRRVLARVRLEPADRPRLLDVGCGRGLRFASFLDKGFECAGMDFQQAVVEHVQAAVGVPAVRATFEDVADHFAPGSFDLITAYYVLEHVPDVGVALRQCHALLRPGGWLAAAVPLADSWQAATFRSRWSQATEAPRHLSLPSREGLRRAADRAGFAEVHVAADATHLSAQMLVLSLLPTSTTAHLYGGGRLLTLCKRALAGCLLPAAWLWCLVEEHVLRRPAAGLLLARKPATLS